MRKKQEIPSMRFRRSIFVIKDVKKNELFSKKNLKIIRPGNGLSPETFSKIINKKYASKNIAVGEPLKKNMIK